MIGGFYHYIQLISLVILTPVMLQIELLGYFQVYLNRLSVLNMRNWLWAPAQTLSKSAYSGVGDEINLTEALTEKEKFDLKLNSVIALLHKVIGRRL